MRIMFLNHSFVRHSAALEAHIRELLTGYASPGTTFELAYPDDLGGGAVLSPPPPIPLRTAMAVSDLILLVAPAAGLA